VTVKASCLLHAEPVCYLQCLDGCRSSYPLCGRDSGPRDCALSVSRKRINDQTLEIASCIVVDGEEDSDDCIVVEVKSGV